MGFHMVARAEVLDLLAENVGEGGRPGRWTVEAQPDIVAGMGCGDRCPLG
jgi:hypothetical protein